ncbi:uncharacterized protein LOC130654470 [Hydractinia symbiolongicarpus]|uniref:uncharacterized protein LOC130654470 n=1 Tax=Hydractinia symbiolongicarpus TaxID=13093 RepID=UPI00254A2833|nr:uncharacterized protein LOC130654470 [Hydractinia symbiolongicarpus]
MDKKEFLILSILIVAISAEWTDTVAKGFSEADDKITKIAKSIGALGRQIMLQKFYAEQRTRSDGDSGLKVVRIRRQGNKNYHSESHNGFSIASIHDHANNIRTVGMGEIEAVLNGVQFRTRHNDYRLFMPSRNETTYHKTEEIPFPDVPPSVQKQVDLNAATAEMREYFRAWRDQNTTHRNYEPYFKSVLCYLEGGWTQSSSGGSIDEPFKSDRHFVDAKSWQELQQKNMFTDYTGSKSRLENLALLPTTIMGFYNDTIPIFAQFNYRIACHPTKKLLPTDRMRPVDDLASRFMTNSNVWRYVNSRQARFQVNMENSSVFNDQRTYNTRTFLDELMEEIPGKDNYVGNLTDEGFESEVLNVDGTRKNAAFYHRWFSVKQRDAMGVSTLKRGYSDNFMFAAMTSNKKVAPMSITKCKKPWDKRTCYTLTQRWTYAIPLEIIYLTPLSKWNPYNFQYRGKANTVDGKKVNINGRYGGCVTGKEYDGVNSRIYYLTPTEFFSGQTVGQDTADTTRRGDVCVLDRNGQPKKVRASGTRIFLPDIKDVGILRQRYPIMPIHGEGSSVWKEFSALRDIVMDPAKSNMKWTSVSEDSGDITLRLKFSEKSGVTPHRHEVRLSKNEVIQLKGGFVLERTSNTRESHTHTLKIRYKNAKYEYYNCDGKYRCWDLHPRTLEVVA